MEAQKPLRAARAHSLDALRGYAIMTMILSATEAFHVLPPWMYHAQLPPPDHLFSPTTYGITWVDLIFPFFLFSMGAAIPLSLGRQYDKGVSRRVLAWKSVLRWLKLSFFAVFIMHAFPFMLGYGQQWLRYAVPLVCFALLCLMFLPNPLGLSRRGAGAVKTLAYVAGCAIVWFQPYANGLPFQFTDTDIIIMILANVSLTGALLYLATIHRPWHRLALLPFIAALFMSAPTAGSWASWLMHASLVPWLYEIPYQEYLLIIIPGTVAGEWLAAWLQTDQQTAAASESRVPLWGVALLALAVIGVNVVFLFARLLVANLCVTAVLVAVLLWMLGKTGDNAALRYLSRLCKAGSYLLLLGLFIEAYEGGIRKDDVTISYLLVTCGLAFFALLFFTVVCDHYHVRWLSLPLEMTGKNPMVAYVSSSMMVIPLLALLHLYPFVESMSTQAWSGFLKGVLLTAASMAFTAWFTHKKWFWKT